MKVFAEKPVHAMVLDIDGRVLASSRQLTTTLGLDAAPIGEVAWDTPSIRAIPGLADRLARSFHLAITIGDAVESLPVHLDLGCLGVWVGAIFPIHDDTGALSCWYWEVVDTAVAAPEHRSPASTSAAFLDHEFVISPAPMVVTGPDGRISDANPAWFALVGEAAQSLLRLGAIGSLSPDDREVVDRGLQLVASGATPWFEALWTPAGDAGAAPPATFRWMRLDDSPGPGESRLLGIARDLHGARTHLAGLRAFADRDHLTGLANRRAFDLALAAAVSRIGLDHEAILLFLMDLDGLKRVNDAFGHAAGDALLVAVAERLGSACAWDMVARIGGDEFAGWVTVAATTGTGEQAIADIRAAVERPMAGMPHLGTPHISVGSARITDRKTDLAAAFDAADIAMYASKAASRQDAGQQAAP